VLVFQYNITVIELELFSFSGAPVPLNAGSTAKEIIFNSASFASQAKRAVKQYKKMRDRTYELER
jgi:hypothetical protein